MKQQNKTHTQRENDKETTEKLLQRESLFLPDDQTYLVLMFINMVSPNPRRSASRTEIWYLIIPSSCILLIRFQQGDADKPTFFATSETGILLSSCKIRNIRRSILSIQLFPILEKNH